MGGAASDANRAILAVLSVNLTSFAARTMIPFLRFLTGVLLGALSSLSLADVPTAPRALALSSYKGISLDAFEKAVASGFSSEGFTVDSIRRERDKDGQKNIEMKFKYPLESGDSSAPPLIIVKIDGVPDRNGKCILCFLRGPYIEDPKTLNKLSWMEKYEIKYQINSRLDNSIKRIQDNLLKFSENPSITTEKYYSGELNTEKDSNSFIAISPSELKKTLISQLSSAGFILINESNPLKIENSFYLDFIYPYSSSETIGAQYRILIQSQLDKSGNCYPCEVKELFDPYQNLPAPGLAGILDRATISTRFYSSLSAAQDQMQSSLSPYLRPRTNFFRMKSSVTLGTPRPRPIYPVVT